VIHVHRLVKVGAGLLIDEMLEESKKRHARIIEALRANPNARAVARELRDVSDTTIRRVARKHGILLKWGSGAANKDIIVEELKKIAKG